MTELTPEARVALWKAGKLDVDKYNKDPYQWTPNEPTTVDLKVKWLSDYEGWKRIGLSDTEALAKIQKLEDLLQESMRGSTRPRLMSSQEKIYTGPQGGRYRINSNGRKSYDVP